METDHCFSHAALVTSVAEDEDVYVVQAQQYNLHVHEVEVCYCRDRLTMQVHYQRPSENGTVTSMRQFFIPHIQEQYISAVQTNHQLTITLPKKQR